MNIDALCPLGIFSAAILATAASAPMDPGIWAQYGLAGLVVGVTLLRDYHREQIMREIQQRSESWIQRTLLGALERNTQALERLSDHGEK